MPVKKTLSGRAVDPDFAEVALNQEVIPVLAEMRDCVNDLDSQPAEQEADEALILRFDLDRRVLVTLSRSVTSIAIVDPPGGGDFTVLFVQGGGFTVTGWPSNVKWFGGGTEPVITATAGRVDMVRMHFDGENYYAEIAQDAV